MEARQMKTTRRQFVQGSMCAGLPVGDEKLKAMLKYAKSLDSQRVRLLPKTPTTAWRRLAKVSNNISNLYRCT